MSKGKVIIRRGSAIDPKAYQREADRVWEKMKTMSPEDREWYARNWVGANASIDPKAYRKTGERVIWDREESAYRVAEMERNAGFFRASSRKSKPARKQTVLYIAYGSNLHIRSMRRRCPDAEPLGTRMLSNARLVFRSVADLAYEPGAMTPVALWQISLADEIDLDRYEGVSSGMYGRYWIPLSGRYRGRKALVYLMHDTGIFPPSAAYASTIRDGYRNFELDQSYLDEAIAHSFDQKAPSQQTRSRRKGQRALRQPLVEMPEEVALARLDNTQIYAQVRTDKFPFQKSGRITLMRDEEIEE